RRAVRYAGAQPGRLVPLAGRLPAFAARLLLHAHWRAVGHFQPEIQRDHFSAAQAVENLDLGAVVDAEAHVLEMELSVFHQRDEELPAPAEERLGRKQRPWRTVERQPGLNEGARIKTLGRLRQIDLAEHGSRPGIQALRDPRDARLEGR